VAPPDTRVPSLVLHELPARPLPQPPSHIFRACGIDTTEEWCKCQGFSSEGGDRCPSVHWSLLRRL
jgi:hypothetical protein